MQCKFTNIFYEHRRLNFDEISVKNEFSLNDFIILYEILIT